MEHLIQAYFAANLLVTGWAIGNAMPKIKEIDSATGFYELMLRIVILLSIGLPVAIGAWAFDKLNK